MADFNSKYTGQEVENLLDQVAKGNTGGGGTTTETDPIFSASPAFSITDEDIDSWNGKQDTISDLEEIRSGAEKGATAVQPSTLSSVATSGDYKDLNNKPTIPTKLGDLSNNNILTCEFMGEVSNVIWSDDDQDRIGYIADWMEALSMGKVCVLDFDEYENTYAMVHAINYRNDATYGIGKVYFSYIFEGYLYDVEYESVSLPVTLTIVNKTKVGGGAEPMVCAYRITSYTANHIELENYTYNGQTMYYREGAIVLITNPLGEDVVFEGGTLTLDGNEYEADAFTLKVGATALFTLGVDSGILFPASSVVESNSGGTTKEVVIVGSDTIDLLEPNKVYILSVPQTTLQISDIAYPEDSYAEYCIMGMRGETFTGSDTFETQPISLLLPTDVQFYWAGESQDSLTTGDTWELSIAYTSSALIEGFKCVLTKFT